MKITKIILPLLFGAMTQISYSQVTSKETVKTDTVNHQMTITQREMGYERKASSQAIEYFNKGTDYGNKGAFEDAKKWYLKAIAEDDKYVEAYDNLGLVYRRLGEVEKAVEYYKKSIKIYPEGLLAHQNLGAAYGILNNHEGAIKEYEKILVLAPNDPEGYFGLANSNMMLSKFDIALENAEKALELYKKTNSHHIADGYQMMGLIYYYQKENEKAKVYLQKAKDLGASIHPQLERDLFENDDDKIRMETPEDYKSLEGTVVKVFDWIMETPLGEEQEKRKEFNAFLIQWMTGTPTISIEISAEVITYMDCADCLTIFMGGWSKYAIQAKDKATKLGGNVAGTEAVVAFYNKNKKALGKNKDIEKWVKRQKKGKLESYIKSKM